MPVKLWIIALNAVIAPLAALGGVWLGGRLQARNTRLQVQLSNQSAAYLHLTEFLVRLRDTANAPASAAEDMSQLADALKTGEWIALQASILSFGSDGIRATFDDALTKRAQLRSALNAWNEELEYARQNPQAPRSTDLLADLNLRREETLGLIETLLAMVRSELTSR